MDIKTMSRAKMRIRSIIHAVDSDTDIFNIAHSLYSNICFFEPELQVFLFQYACENFGADEYQENHISIPISEYIAQKERLEEQYGDIVKSLIKSFSKENGEESAFYRSLWRIIQESMIFDNEAKKVFALYYILIDKQIPYFKIDEALFYPMSNEHFSTLMRNTTRERQRIRYILRMDVEQRTERASILLNEFGISIPADDNPMSIRDYEKRLMQMVYLLRESDASGEQLQSLISKLQK